MMQRITYEHPPILGKKIKTESNSFFFNYNKALYFIGVHHGYPISYIINDIETLNAYEYNICNWNEIIFKSVTSSGDQFVFNKFSKKQIDSTEYYYCDTKRFTFKNNYYFPINMFPGNPKNLYYVMECINSTIECGDSGSPIYDKDRRLIGIISKIQKNHVYVIPTIYICNSLDKKDNSNIYMISEREPKSIETFNVKNSTIYHASLKTYIDKNAFLVLEGDKDKQVIVNNIKVDYIIFSNCINNTNIIINENKISITTGLLNILKLINKELLLLIFKNFKSKESIVYMGKEYIFN